MRTLYYLSLFGMLSGYGLFAFVWYSFTKGREHLDIKHQLLLSVTGVAQHLPYKALILGVVSTIVFFTI